MSKIQYKHLDFAGASLVQRRHKRQVTPPGMWSATNFLPSRSDDSLTLRPDFEQSNANVFGISSGLQIQPLDETKDFLNSVNGVYGSSDLIWFTTYIPWGKYGTTGAQQILSNVMSTGRASAPSGSYTVSFNNLGGSYNAAQKWWRGCILEFNADGNYYLLEEIRAVSAASQTATISLSLPTQSDYSNTIDYLGAAYKWTASGSGTNEYYFELTGGGDPSAIEPIEVLLDSVSISKGTIGSLADHTWGWGDNDTLGYSTVYIADATGDPDVSGVTLTGYQGHTYKLYRTHNSDRANNNKLAIDEFGAAIIYCSPTIEDNFSARDICGPFYSNVTESDWQYNVSSFRDSSVGTGGSFSYVNNDNYGLATNGTSWILITSSVGFQKALDITSGNAWTWNAFADLTFNVPQPNGDDTFSNARFSSIRRNSSLGFLVSGRLTLNSATGGGDTNYAAVFYSSDNGATWTAKIDAAHESNAYGCEYDGTTMLLVASDGGTEYMRYSTDDGDTWSNCAGVASFTTPTNDVKVKYVNSTFIVIDDENIHSSSDGQTFSTKDISGDVTPFACNDIAYNEADGGTAYWVAIDDTNTTIVRATTVGGTYSDVTPTWLSSVTWYQPNLTFVLYDVIGTRFIINCGTFLLVSSDYGATWVENRAGWGNVKLLDEGPVPSNLDWSGQLIAGMFDNTATKLQHVVLDRSYSISWDVDLFVPISDLYRATTFSIIDGYNLLLGTSEWNAGDSTWSYYPKRLRWTAPGTYNDFTGASGAGTADAAGPGAFLAAVNVNGRVVVFETNRVSAIVPRGDTSDPFDYDIIKDDFKFLSNPVAVNEIAYVIGSDGLLWQTDGIDVTEVGASFDLTKFDDFSEDKPVWLVYSRKENSLYVFFREAASTTNPAYCISLANGSLTEVDLIEVDDTVTKAEEPAAVVALTGSTKQDLYVTHHPFNADTDLVVVAELNIADQITGNDNLGSSQTGYWAATLESGELFITQEGDKASLKHFIIETYTEDTVGDNSDRPYIVAEVKSLEDSDYATSGDTQGTATMTTTALTGASTAWSTLIAGPNAGSTQQKCNGATTDFTVAGNAANYRYYLDSTLQSAYTTSGSTVSFTTAPGATKTLYGYSENIPEVKAKVGDFFKSTEGWHRVTAIGSAQDITLDHYLSTGSETVTHYPAWQMDDGHGRIELGINRLVEGVQIRLYMIPDYNGTNQSTVAKMTGLSIGYVPQGRKIVKATGS